MGQNIKNWSNLSMVNALKDLISTRLPIAIGELGLNGSIYEAFSGAHYPENQTPDIGRMIAALGHYKIYGTEEYGYRGRKVDSGYSLLPRVTLTAGNFPEDSISFDTVILKGQDFLPSGIHVELYAPKELPIKHGKVLERKPAHTDSRFHRMLGIK